MKKLFFLFFCFITFIYASNINEIEPNNTWRQATQININDIGIGNLNGLNDDTDWWKFTPTKSGILTIYTTGASKDIDAELYGIKLIDVDYKANNNIYMQIFVQANKTYYLLLFLNQLGTTSYNLHFSFFPIKNTATFHPIFNENLNGKLNVIGNHNICYTNGTNQCLNPGNADNNNIIQNYINIDQNAIDNGYINSSEADLNLTTGDNIVKAYLFWQGRIRTNDPINDNAIKNANKVEFKTPTTNDYVTIDANQSSFNWYYGSDGVFDYGAYADVTQYVQKSGQYYVANLQVSQGYNTGGGWSLVVITQNPKDKFKKIVVYHGFQAIYNAEGYPPSVTQTLKGFYTPMSGPVNASFIFFANETDKNLDDSITLTDKDGRKHYLSNDLNPSNNVLNCTISRFGKNVINRNPHFENTLGTDIDEFNVSNIFDNSQTETNITINSNGDRVFLEMFGVSIQLYVPKVCYYDFNLYDENGHIITANTKLFSGEKIKIKYKIKNDENEIAKNVYIIYPFDDNITKYIQNSTNVKNVLNNNYIHFDDNSSNENLGVYVDNNALIIGILGDNNNDFLPYDTNQNYNAGIEFNVTLQKEGNLSFVFYTDYNYSIGNQNYSYNGVLPKCSEFENNYNVYTPLTGGFNVVHYQPAITKDPTDVNNSINALYTQIVNQDFNVTVVKLADDNETLENYTGFVKLDLIQNPQNETECKTLPSLIPPEYIEFNNESKKNITLKINKVYRNVRFRIRYLKYGSGCFESILNLITNFNPDNIVNIFQTCSSCATTCATNMIGCSDLNSCEEGINACLDCVFSKGEVETICSRDNFAIRPYAFLIFGQNQYKRAGEDFNITIKAVDKTNYEKDLGTMNDIVGVSGYNENLNDLNVSAVFYTPTDAETRQMNMDVYDINDTNKSRIAYCPDPGKFTIVNGNQFVNGEINTTMKYSESGILTLRVAEINGSEFAKVDEKDTPDSQRLIKPGTFIINKNDLSQRNLLLEFIPYKFVTDGVYNSTTGGFVYMNNINNSIIPKMAAFLEYNITAENKDGQKLLNYTKTCFPDVSDNAPSRNGLKLNTTFDLFLDANMNINNEVNLSFSNIDTNDNSHIWLLHPELNLTSGNHHIQQWIAPLNFNEGVGRVKLFFNIKKDYRHPKNEVNITVNDINTSTSWMNNPGATKIFIGKSLNKTINFRYGRIDVGDISGYGNEINTTFKYEYWSNEGWKLNKEHNSSIFGDVNKSSDYQNFVNNQFDVNMNVHNIVNGEENVTLSTKHALPYSTKIHLSIPSWLWYHPLAKNYKNPSSTNLNCLTHPCFNVNFQKQSSGWGGIGSNEGNYSAQKRTTEINASTSKIKANKSEVRKLNW